jgi:hypothetical protein
VRRPSLGGGGGGGSSLSTLGQAATKRVNAFEPGAYLNGDKCVCDGAACVIMCVELNASFGPNNLTDSPDSLRHLERVSDTIARIRRGEM